MGNCQAIDSATLLIQHQSGRVEKHYWPIPASDVIKSNPGHCVALLLTTTTTTTSYPPSSSSDGKNSDHGAGAGVPLRVTRIKLLRPSDVLVLGHVYRLVTSQEVMKGLRAKKQAKILQQKQQQSSGNGDHARISSEKKVVSGDGEKRQSSNSTVTSAAAIKSRMWQPSLKSISEAAGN